MKYKIIIEPKDKMCCGKCTYRSKKHIRFYCSYDADYCLLFKKILEQRQLRQDDFVLSPARCGDCKILCETFEKMPELEEVV